MEMAPVPEILISLLPRNGRNIQQKQPLRRGGATRRSFEIIQSANSASPRMNILRGLETRQASGVTFTRNNLRGDAEMRRTRRSLRSSVRELRLSADDLFSVVSRRVRRDIDQKQPPRRCGEAEPPGGEAEPPGDA
jgi:hypothetical protein